VVDLLPSAALRIDQGDQRAGDPGQGKRGGEDQERGLSLGSIGRVVSGHGVVESWYRFHMSGGWRIGDSNRRLKGLRGLRPPYLRWCKPTLGLPREGRLGLKRPAPGLPLNLWPRKGWDRVESVGLPTGGGLSNPFRPTDERWRFRLRHPSGFWAHGPGWCSLIAQGLGY
jgi:hypothetical protein